MFRFMRFASWLFAGLALLACLLLVREYRTLYIAERLTSVQLVPAISATKLPMDWDAGGRRVLLIGDSRVQGWAPLLSDADLTIALSGIGRETAGQLERRFARDALALDPPPDMIIIAAGVNDLVAASMVEDWAEQIQAEAVVHVTDRLGAMAAMALARGIDVRLATIVQPASPDALRRFFYLWDDRLYGMVAETNVRIQAAAEESGAGLIDFNTALGGGNGPLPAPMALDTLHFNQTAYEVLNDYLRQRITPE